MATAASNASAGGGTSAVMLERLDGQNNVNWKFAMRMALTLEGLWNCVEGDETDSVKNGRALARICLALQPSLYQYVREAKTPKEAWKQLADTFESKGLYRKVLLLRQLHRVEYGNFPSMPEYIEGVMRLVHQLGDIGKKIDDDEVAEILLSGLPQEFDVLVSSLETACLANNLTTELVRARLLQEDERKKSSDGVSAYIVKHKPKMVCHYCKRSGHVEKRCFKKKREEKKKENEHTLLASAFVATTSDFIVDSGASTHMCADKSLLEEIKTKNSTISIANGQHLTSECLERRGCAFKLCLMPYWEDACCTISEGRETCYYTTGAGPQRCLRPDAGPKLGRSTIFADIHRRLHEEDFWLPNEA